MPAQRGVSPPSFPADPGAPAPRARDVEERLRALQAKVAWVLDDAVYTAPEDSDRRRRQYDVLATALAESRKQGAAS